MNNTSKDKRILRGIAVSPGIKIAEAYIVEPKKLKAKYERIHPSNVDYEIIMLEAALKSAVKELKELKSEVNRKHNEEHYLILEAHQMILEDETFSSQVIQFIENSFFNANWALKLAVENFANHFGQMEDEVFQKRAADFKDVGHRVLQQMNEERGSGIESIPKDAIVVAKNITPGQATHFYKKPIQGLVLEVGGKASHIAIISRSMEIPAVLGLSGITSKIKTGDMLIVDGRKGLVILNPTDEQQRKYSEKIAHYEDLQRRLHNRIDEPAITKDGKRIVLKGNIEAVNEIDSLKKHGAEGIGLFRTEFIYMDRLSPPTEEEHYEYYKELCLKCECGPITIRTVDIGADKTPVYWPITEETNPALGYRAVRTIYGNERYFIDQVRAIYRAAVHGNVKLLLPFISGVAEFEQVRAIINQVKNDLKNEKKPYNPDVPLGIMVELPSAAILSDIFADRVDFFSIGTNDLIQYTLAVDRDADLLSHMYDPLHPAILRLIKLICKNGKAGNIDVALCGEMASEAVYTKLLIGLGVTELDMPSSSIPYVKEIIRSTTLKEAEEMVERVLACTTAVEIEEIVLPEMLKKFPELFSDLLG